MKRTHLLLLVLLTVLGVSSVGRADPTTWPEFCPDPVGDQVSCVTGTAQYAWQIVHDTCPPNDCVVDQTIAETFQELCGGPNYYECLPPDPRPGWVEEVVTCLQSGGGAEVTNHEEGPPTVQCQY